MSTPTFTEEELRQQAQGNALAMLLVTVAYLKRTGGSLADWTRSAAGLLSPFWREATGFDAQQLARVWALNLASTGGVIQSLEGDANRAELIVTNWPDGETLQALGLTREDTDPLLDIADLLMSSVGGHATWTRAGDRLSFAVTR